MASRRRMAAVLFVGEFLSPWRLPAVLTRFLVFIVEPFPSRWASVRPSTRGRSAGPHPAAPRSAPSRTRHHSCRTADPRIQHQLELSRLLNWQVAALDVPAYVPR